MIIRLTLLESYSDLATRHVHAFIKIHTDIMTKLKRYGSGDQ